MRRQLTGLVAVLLSGVLLVLLVPVVLLVHLNGQQRALLSALERAQSLVPVGVAPPLSPSVACSASALPVTRDARGWLVTVYRSNGRVCGVPVPRSPAVLAAERSQLATVRADDDIEVVLPALETGGGASLIRVAGDAGVWRTAALRTSLLAVAGAVVVLLIGVLAADRMARRQLARMDAQRVRSADLTHRLRTPLTALRLGVDGLPDRRAAQRLAADLDALTNEVDEVIRDVRRNRPGATPSGADLTGVAAERVEFWSALAEDTGRVVTVVLPDRPVWVRAARADLGATLDALLGNVFAHTPNGTPLRITVRAPADGGAVLVVDDAGPGFGHPDGLRRGRSGSASTGLGLDIARRTAEGSGGSIRLATSASGGARVELRLGPPSEP